MKTKFLKIFFKKDLEVKKKSVSLQPISEERVLERASSASERTEIIDNIGKDNEVKAKIEAEISYNCKVIAGKTISRRDARASRSTQREGYKSERGMPRLQEARKDAASCEKARGSASMK